MRPHKEPTRPGPTPQTMNQREVKEAAPTGAKQMPHTPDVWAAADPSQFPSGRTCPARWSELSVGDGIRVLDRKGIIIQGIVDTRSPDGRTIWITGGNWPTRRLFHIGDDIRLERTTRAINRT